MVCILIFNVKFFLTFYNLNVSIQVQGRQLVVTGRIFSIQSVKHKSMKKGNVLRLFVNFQPEVITLSKEVLYSFIFQFTCNETLIFLWKCVNLKVEKIGNTAYVLISDSIMYFITLHYLCSVLPRIFKKHHGH